MDLTKEKMEQIREEIEDALYVISINNDININLKRVSFDQASFNASIEGIIAGKESEMFDQLAKMNCPEMVGKYGQEFKFDGKHLRVVGIKPRAIKNKVQLLDINTNQEYKAPTALVTRYI